MSHPPRRPAADRPARLGLACLLSALGMLAMAPLQAATCSLSVQPLSFGNYDFQSTQDLASVGHVIVTCDVSSSFTIALSPGAGTFTARTMQSGVHRLNYNLYTDPTRTMVWGDGSGGSTVLNGNGMLVDQTVYGKVPAGQNPYIGIYSDAITVTLTF
jgi:spore coat protein U-like protein